jgi:hypothetical protein
VKGGVPQGERLQYAIRMPKAVAECKQ